MSEQRKQVRVLPIHFVALDLERKTRPIALVACPRRQNEATPVTLCGKCGHCRQIAFAFRNDVALTCDAPLDVPCAEDTTVTPRLVHDFTRVPRVCVALDTHVRTLILRLGQDSDELIPVLDDEGCLLGVVVTADLLGASSLAKQALDGTAADLMIEAPRSIRCDAAELEAVRMFAEDSSRYLTVTGAGGRFLGTVDREDLAKTEPRG